jgi:hypothetical protein
MVKKPNQSLSSSNNHGYATNAKSMKKRAPRRHRNEAYGDEEEVEEEFVE